MTSVFFLPAKPISYSSFGGCGLHLGGVKSLRLLNSWEELYVFVLYSFWVLLFIVIFSCGIEVDLKFSRMLFNVPGRKKNSSVFPFFIWYICVGDFEQMLICCMVF